jgi:hypothetical protein
MVLSVPKNRFRQKAERSKGGDSEPAPRESVWAPTGMDESVVQPAADEGDQQREAPSLGAGSSFGGKKRRRGVGRWWGLTPLFATESESTCKRPIFKPRLRFFPRVLPASLLWPPWVPYGRHLQNGSLARALSG